MSINYSYYYYFQSRDDDGSTSTTESKSSALFYRKPTIREYPFTYFFVSLLRLVDDNATITRYRVSSLLSFYSITLRTRCVLLRYMLFFPFFKQI